MRRDCPHFELTHVDHQGVVAFVGPGVDGEFVVEFASAAHGVAIPATVTHDVVREIDYYLVQKGEPDPWTYARHHCGTTANAYARVGWSYIAADDGPPR